MGFIVCTGGLVAGCVKNANAGGHAGTLYGASGSTLYTINYGTTSVYFGLAGGSKRIEAPGERQIGYDPAEPGRKIALWSESGEDKKIRVYPTADIASLAVYDIKTG